jgi:hypothetical protein
MKRAKFFSVVDLRKGYWSNPKIYIYIYISRITSFRTPQGFFQWKVLPMGIKTASPIFAQTVDQMSSNYSRQHHPNMMGENANSEKFVFAYVDDIIVYSKTEEEHAKNIADILRRIK